MIRKDYWIIKPQTERKLEILESYIDAWSKIIFNQYAKNRYRNWQTPYYVDCFSGRGMYHKGDEKNNIKGSPIRAIETFIRAKKKLETEKGVRIDPKVRLIEFDNGFANELENFVQPYRSDLDIKILKGDFNDKIDSVLSEVGASPTLFFVDPGGIKELKQESVSKIVSKKGARDILLNYVVDGQLRIGGLGKKVISGNYKAQGKRMEGALKTIKRLEDFTGLDIYKFLEETGNDMREALLNYISNVLHANNTIVNEKDRLETLVFDMKDLERQKLVYYLLFCSRKTVATKIMESIFKASKKKESTQMGLFGTDILKVKK